MRISRAFGLLTIVLWALAAALNAGYVNSTLVLGLSVDDLAVLGVITLIVAIGFVESEKRRFERE